MALPNAHSSSHQATLLSDATAIVASGGWHDTCAVVVGGTVRCWGDNSKAGLGDNTQVPSAPAPVEVCASGSWAVAANGCLDGQTVSTLTDVASVAVGGDHACALSTAGGVKCWGIDSLGQLGDGFVCLGSECAIATPQQVAGLESGVVAISAGLSHTCALVEVEPPETDFRATCWGYNHFAQLGDGHVCSLHVCPTPVQPVGLESGVAQISAGTLHTCAVLAAGGEVKCWGLNFDGELGDGTTAVLRTTPVNVCPTGAAPPCLVALQGASLVTARGVGHSCAVMEQDGSVKCWGGNDSGQLGDATTTPSLTPVDVCAVGGQAPCAGNLLSGATSVTAGFYHTCALMADATARCWGANDSGQLGVDQDGPMSSTPVAVCNSAGGSPCTSLSGVEQLSSGFTHNCGLIAGGTVSCWGANDRGELGDNSTIARPAPVSVTLDSDRDGCKDDAEINNLPLLGGDRDPTSYWDLYDVPDRDTGLRDQVINIPTDILGVASRFGNNDNDGAAPINRNTNPLSNLGPPPPSPGDYHPAWDRKRLAGPGTTNLVAPDGTVNLPDDILGAALQFGHNCREAGTPDPDPEPSDVTIDVGEFWYCDSSFESGVCETTIDAGETVSWDFSQVVLPHTSTDCGADCDTPTGSPIWDSGLLATGTFNQTFDSVGTFNYYCSIHPDTMRGRIVVN